MMSRLEQLRIDALEKRIADLEVSSAKLAFEIALLKNTAPPPSPEGEKVVDGFASEIERHGERPTLTLKRSARE